MTLIWVSLVAQMVMSLLAVQEIWVRSLGQEDPLEKGVATHSSILAWRIPWTEDIVGHSPWGCKESDMTERLTLSLFKLLGPQSSSLFPSLLSPSH